ncbi:MULTISPECIES: (d)CMP kinase [Xanthomarina]|jgi:cytidylate kinase|uniref:Cytidylate kinase n=1 Tax=Xanthomarina gelatinilytica TaxID=1137281 RepID=M7MGK1_9FLAO|nr:MULTISPECIES: (d)CMP kinase [Xanthomarina]MCB0388907.1 (d)CMP kinase [Winogradskyella sp.]EMQ93950.1 Cytidylate kinase [Xanthomarina gelatinilytica]MAL21740.1 (d)CMP kinase [Xanthomarina sp.]MBF62857.1 (d)CMP kinase [Xanthomarina sp.]MDX1317760.1 (d)CMP kinase [Xanthomarina gelatinilytica]|tara:strand:+ start:2439 stop:3122 length:684 start_codon:yes stop_codon:yes gene_type:complete
MNKITIAIDGFSSTGKSTVAKQLANHLGYIYVDSGAMYRAVTWYAMQHHFISNTYFHVQDLIAHLDQIDITFTFNPNLGYAEVYLNGKNVEKQIRTLEVSGFVSQVAEISEVRELLVKQQQKMGESKGIVMDGRDIGTVVFPNAELKIFMTASPETRANRRYQELLSKGEQVSYNEVLHNVQERDYIDSNRKDSPLVKAKDAIEIDNSNLSLEEQFNKILQLVETKL